MDTPLIAVLGGLGKNPAELLVERLEQEGVRVLMDGNVQLAAANGRPFAIVGLQDAFVTKPDFEAAWEGLPDGVQVL